MLITQQTLKGIGGDLLQATDAEMYQFGDDGILLNTDPPVPFVDITSVDGLSNAPVRLQTHDRDGLDGGYVDSEYESIRTVTLEGIMYCDPSQTETFLDQMKANFAPTKDPVPLYFTTDADQRFVVGKSQGLTYTKDPQRSTGIVAFQVQILCEDPRIYSVGMQSAKATLKNFSQSGFGFDLAFDFGFGTSNPSNTCDLFLSGNRESPGTFLIRGPILNPQIINDSLGITMRFGLTLSDTDTLLIDLYSRAVLLNGTANRRYALTFTSGGWYTFAPGDNYLRIGGVKNGSQAPTLTASAYSAWR